MTLKFPTMAERAVEEYTRDKTPISTIAKREGATSERSWPAVLEYVFDDESVVVITGRGKAYKAEARLP